MNVETARMDRDHLDPTRRRCSRRTALRAGAAGIAATTLVAAGRRTALAQSATPEASPADQRDFTGLVDIGGRNLYLECHGTGSPTVVLVSGYRASGRFWTDDLLHPDDSRQMVLPGVAKATRVCTYDRPGTYAEITEEIIPSRSDAITQPRTSMEV